MRHPLLIVLIFCFCCLIGVRSASAHANLLRSDPPASTTLDAVPQVISLWFSEALEPEFSRITLLDAQGNPISTPPSVVDPADPRHLILQPGDLADGLYTVSWRAISAADGHQTRGSFAFAIGAVTGMAALAAPDTETIPPLSAAVRWFDILALALLVGSVAFAVCVWCAPPQERHMRRLMGVDWVLVGVAGLVLLVYQAAQATDSTFLAAIGALGAVVSGSRFGLLWIGRMVVWAVMGAAIWRRRYGIALAAGMLILLLHSLFSHASATFDLIPAIAGDWLHLAATALWVGGLVQFVNLLIGMPKSTPQTFVPLVARFSNYARVCVAALIVTGLYVAWLEVGSVAALTGTLYGRALLVKGILFAPLLLIAAINLMVTPRGLKAGRSAWIGRLRGLIGVEIALTLGIFAAVAVMSSVNPGRSALASLLPPPNHGFSDYQIADDIHIHFDVTPGWVGENTFIVTLFDLDSDPVDNATLIRVRFDNLEQNVGQSELRPQFVGDGEYKITGANLSVPGEWRARVSVQRADKFDTLADFTLDMTAAPTPPGLDMSAALSGRQWTLLITGLALLAIGGFAGGRGRFEPLRGIGLLATLTILVGVVFLIGAVV